MTKIKLLLLAPFILLNILVIAQSKSTKIGLPNETPTVIPDGGRLNDKEIRDENIKLKISEKEKELRLLLTKLNLSNRVYDWDEYATWDSKERLNEQITINEKVAYTYDKNPAIFSLCNEIENLNAQLKGSKSNTCESHTRNRQLARQNSDNAKARINQLNGIIKKENYNKTAHQAEMDLLDKELQDVNNNSKNLSSQLDAINNKNTSKSLDNFLASNNSTSNDFLSESKSNTNDFLSGSSNGSSDDFLSDSNHDSDFKITTRNGLTGVVNEKGEILIPFKDWTIVEYKMGIAKVSTVVASKGFSAGTCIGSYYSSITKVGFADASGNYINGSTLSSSGGWIAAGCLTLTYNDANNNISWEQMQRNKARAKKQNEYKKEQAIYEGQQWTLNYIRL